MEKYVCISWKNMFVHHGKICFVYYGKICLYILEKWVCILWKNMFLPIYLNSFFPVSYPKRKQQLTIDINIHLAIYE